MSSRSSHANFLLYFQKMLLNADCESGRNPGNRKVGIVSAAARRRRHLQGPPLVGPMISPRPAAALETPEKKPKLR